MDLDNDFLLLNITANEQGHPHNSGESDEEYSSDNAIEEEPLLADTNEQELPHDVTDEGIPQDVTDDIPLATNRNEESTTVHPLAQTRLSDVSCLPVSSLSITFNIIPLYRIMTGDSMLVQKTIHCCTLTTLTPHTLPSSLVTMAIALAMTPALSQISWSVTINSCNHDFI